jgi:hypothetical protein
VKRLIIVALLLGLAACDRHSTPTTPDDAPVVDMDLMAFLSEARALHHQANLKEESGDIAGAVAAMQRLVTARQPRNKAPEVEEVLADAYARLAELELKRNNLDAASTALTSGLQHTPEPTYFKGHLIEIEGLVEEARSASLADAGKPAEAAASREKAIQLLEEVVRIQDQVIQKSLSTHDAEVPK